MGRIRFEAAPLIWRKLPYKNFLNRLLDLWASSKYFVPAPRSKSRFKIFSYDRYNFWTGFQKKKSFKSDKKVHTSNDSSKVKYITYYIRQKGQKRLETGKVHCQVIATISLSKSYDRFKMMKPTRRGSKFTSRPHFVLRFLAFFALFVWSNSWLPNIFYFWRIVICIGSI